MSWNYTQEPVGLYDPAGEKDACGVGAVCQINGKPDRIIMNHAKSMLVRMSHRGGEMLTPSDGDGAGILVGMPPAFFDKVCDFDLPSAGEFGVGNVFLPHDPDRRSDCVKLITKLSHRSGLVILGWRDVPVDRSVLGPYASSTEPHIAQVFLSVDNASSSHDGFGELERVKPVTGPRGGLLAPVVSSSGKRLTPRGKAWKAHREGSKALDLETRLFVLRRAVAQREKSELFFCSLSSRTLTFKGQLKAEQVFTYFTDLSSPDFTSHLALIHSRFSTNSFPSWSRAHPFRKLCHNGEINTLQGNKHHIEAREALFEDALSSLGLDLPPESLSPVDEGIGSDSAYLDNLIEVLTSSGVWDIAESMLMLIPEAWQQDKEMPKEKRDFYRFLSCLCEPWDGPALVAFSDGKQLGAVLDRNGLRPCRYTLTTEGQLILASEVGVVDVHPEDVLRKGRLSPGKMLLVDFEDENFYLDEELKSVYAKRHPYGQWLEENAVFIDESWVEQQKERERGLLETPHSDEEEEEGRPQPEPEVTLEMLDVPPQELISKLTMFGFNTDSIDVVLGPMAKAGQDGLGSMGCDTPLACLSKLPQHPSAYFSQLFAQATNPAIDPLREANVMSLECPIGPEGSLLAPRDPSACRRVILDEPVLCPWRYQRLLELDESGWGAVSLIDLSYRKHDDLLMGREVKKGVGFREVSEKSDLEERLLSICSEAEAAVRADKTAILVLSDRRAGPKRLAVSSLLAVGAVNQHLVNQKLRAQVCLVAEVGDAYSVHQICCLLGFGLDALYPYMAYASLSKVRCVRGGGDFPLDKKVENYRHSVHQGILKVMSKMGISCLHSYKDSQLFQAVGVGKEVLDMCFTGCPHVLDGVGFAILHEDQLRLHKLAYPDRAVPPLIDEESRFLPDVGGFHLRSVATHELHMNSPDALAKVQEAAKENSEEAFHLYEKWQNALVDECELRGMLDIAFDQATPIPLEEVEPINSILKRFCTGAVSFGAISSPTHEALAQAMNKVGGRSNTGEGGEAEDRFGTDRRSKIKQIASGRFGVTAAYLADAEEIQIKLAQGAKPGEGGELPGYKVVGRIAETRMSTPGVGLISPPPHHDMYSIEDVAQLISDLKHINPRARISVKLVSKSGVGIIAAGIVKGKTNHLSISGASGGTGAAKWTSIKHAGLPWELGIAETHQTLMLNGLRDRVVLQADGQIKTARDVLYAALLGAEEIAMTTTPMITLGCIMMRKCHLNTCPVGVATQDPELVKKFKGQPEHLVNFLFLMAEEVRRLMARLGFRTFQDMVGRAEFLRPKSLRNHHKLRCLDFSKLLRPAWSLESVQNRMKADATGFLLSSPCCLASGMEEHLDMDLLDKCHSAVREKQQVNLLHAPLLIRNTDRTVGSRLSFQIVHRQGSKGLPEGTIKVAFVGSAGQSFGAWLVKGCFFQLEGEGNDYVGKGLCGGEMAIFPPRDSTFKSEENVIVGSACLYGATGGRMFVSGMAAERFAVRNSGAISVVEGVGDHACEYMTRGLVVIIGETGKNFAAGMSGGLAYVLDLDRSKCNVNTVYLDPLGGDAREDKKALKKLLEEHVAATGSEKAKDLLRNWTENVQRFTKVFPHEYKRVLKEAIVEHVKTGSRGAQKILDDFDQLRNSSKKRENMVAAYNLWRSEGLKEKTRSKEKKEEVTLDALGLGDIAPFSDQIREISGGQGGGEGHQRAMVSAFRKGYRMWRKGQAKGVQQLRSNAINEKELELLFPRGWDKFLETAGQKPSKKSRGASGGKRVEPLSDTQLHSVPTQAEVSPVATHTPDSGGSSKEGEKGEKEGKRGFLSQKSMQDIEEAGKLLAKKDSRPFSVAWSDKRKGFHEYQRRSAMILRQPKNRIFDWDEVYHKRKAPKTKLYTQLVQTQVARCMDCGTPTCHVPNQGGGGCPLGNRIPTWNQLIHEGEWKLAAERLLDTNNFPEFTGTACPAPCEEACVLGINDDPVAIKATENAIIEYAFEKNWILPKLPQTRTYRKISIIGSGPCGLAAAAQLNRVGHSVSVYERGDRVGGLLVYGIPSMKLDKGKVERRVEILKKEGISFLTQIRIGSDPSSCDVTLSSLLKSNDAVVLATGSTQYRETRTGGRHLKGVHQAMEFLVRSQKSYLDSELEDQDYIDADGKRVIVLGGGDTAVDCVATAVRLGAKSVLQFSRRSRATREKSHWPYWSSDTYRVEYAHAEVEELNGRDPREYEVITKEFLGDRNGRLTGVKAVSVYMEEGRCVEVVGSERVYPCDLVLLAMGFTGPDAMISAEEAPRDANSNFLANYGEYLVKGNLFAAGDCRRGASLLVTAIAEGRDVASRVDEFLMGETVLPRCATLGSNPGVYKNHKWSWVQRHHGGEGRGKGGGKKPTLMTKPSAGFSNFRY